ncbi:hypothetical protein LUZ60_002275 [Juncus effusus]|nr:hypothetical protein LUZ60_002275 [Juncus effusus]
MMKKAPAIGIDLGTTYTCAGVWQTGHVKIIPNNDAQGTNLFPSCVAFKDNERYIGTPAKDQAFGNPHNTIYSIKRLIGRRFSDEKLQRDLKWPFKVVATADDRPKVSVQYQDENKLFLPQQISSMVLRKVKEMANKFLECDIKDAVITVPAYFDELQRNATIEAGRIAGLNVLHIMDEPTAAAVAYGFGMTKTTSKDKNLLVFDLGGGTFDVSVLSIKGSLYNVKAITGDTHLGGDDFDSNLMDYLIEEIKTKFNKDLTRNAKAITILRESCEKTKRSLSSRMQAEVYFDNIGISYSRSITRAFFETLNEELFEECIKLVDKCLIDAKLDKSDIDDVLLIGGSTRIPRVKELLSEFFDNKELCQGINPDEAVAHGAAIMAARLSGHGDKVTRELNVTGITPLSLGTDVVGGRMSIIIPKNTPIPAKMEETYYTVRDYQTEVHVGVYQGERTLIKDNLLLGEFTLTGIPPAPRHVPKIDICFEIDVNGILKVSAKDISGGNEKQITVMNEEGRLSREEVKKMIKEAEQYRSQDEDYERRYLARHSLENYAYKMSKKIKAKSSCSKKTLVAKKAIDDAINWAADNEHPDVSESESKLEELQALMKRLGV